MTDLSPKLPSPIPAEARKVYSGQIFSLHQWPVTLYDGSSATFEAISRPSTVSILAITPDQKILVTRQEQPSRAPFYSLLGGVVDPGEEPHAAAVREVGEEAGISQAEWELWFATRLTEKIDWTLYQYIARDCRIMQPTSHDAGEKIEVIPASWEEFLKIIKRDDFRDLFVALRVFRQMSEPGGEASLRHWLFGDER